MDAFAFVFAIAFVARSISTWLLSKHGEPQPELARAIEPPSPRVLQRDFSDRSTRSLLLYMIAVVFSVQVSGAFFTPYMLEQLGFEYWQLMLVFAITFIAKVIAMPGVGRLAKRYGPGVPLWLGGIGIVPMTTLWLVSDSIYWLCAIQFAVGIAWACWETATFLLVFDVIPSERRTSVLTLYNIANAAAMVGGSLLGATILREVGVDRTGFVAIFVATGLMRLMTLFLLAAIEPRRFKIHQSFDLYLQTLGFDLGGGSIDLPQITDRRPDAREPDAPTRTLE
ncbi:MAG: MFS transporter [Planctomycetota bacterium]|nr:MFS transporter [Planctomycetota bacterium]